MSEPESIVPSGIPQFTGDLDSLDHDTALLTTEAGAFRDAGAGIHSNFQSVAAFYKAPEADQLFATTAPVAAKTATFAGQLEKVSAALSTYSQEVRPLAKKLEDLQRQAFAFTASIKGDDHWRRDEKKRDRNDGLKNEVQATLQAFYEAEIACHNKITALVGGTTLVLGSYGEQKIVRMGTMEYGARAEDLSHMDKLPWGNYAEPEYSGLSWWWHQGKSLVWDGFIVDGIWGTATGIDILLGCGGWDAAGQAWKGLAKVATGLAIMMTPGLNGAFLSAPDSVMPKWFRESRTALKETGKALIAYDEWGKNPARAAGGVTFNVLTTVFTGGAGAAAKGGAVAKTISVLGKVGRVVDPMTDVFKAGGFGVGKVADVFKGLKGLSIGPLTDAAHLTHDPNVPHVTDTYAEWSDGTRLSFKDGTVTRPDGTVSAARVELSADQIAQLKNSPPHAAETSLPGAKSPVLVAAGERAGHGTLDNTTRDSIAGPAAAHEPPGGGGTHNTPSTGGHAADHPTGGGSGSSAGSHTPWDGSGTNTPSGGGGSHGDAPGTGAGSHTESTHGGDGAHGNDPGGDNPASGSADHGSGNGAHGQAEKHTSGERANEPIPELTREERAGHWGHLEEVEKRAPEEFDHLKHDPDHRSKITNDSMDEARVGLDLREQGRLPADIRRPKVADKGEFYSETTGKYYDIKGIHSFWPPFNNVRDPALLARPFPGAYNPARHAQTWVETFTEQIDDLHRIVIVDVRNADQAAIDSIKGIIENHGWGDHVIWYP
ncbi:hypothetical protein ACFYMW_40555 [Streptomyces sp. NPDC006692]|uniref:hypothetical protein n=1 Tax=Streptomyces sp. NPDC006692 TaxID=3364758 RepID=UPI003675E7FB